MFSAVSSPQELCGKLLRGSVDENKSGFSATKIGKGGKQVMSNLELGDALTHELGLPVFCHSKNSTVGGRGAPSEIQQ